jgi:protein-tyrosine phosphatase
MRVLMICLGNICRSPMAEAVLAHLAPDWQVDSAGTGDWHVGDPPDQRTTTELSHHGIVRRHLGRQVQPADFRRYDLILAMDRQNLRNLQALAPSDSTARVCLLGAFDPQGDSEVPDPYYDGPEAFAAIYTQIDRCCRALASSRPTAS